MSWRTVVITGIAKLDYKMDYLVVRKKEATNRIHLSEIGVLVVESTLVSLTTTLLSELVENKIKVIFCDKKHNPFAELMPYYGSHDTSSKVRTQIAWNKEFKELIAVRIITEKICHQRDFLLELGHSDAADKLDKYITEVLPGDPSNREAHAARIYFNALFGNGFTRSKESAINASLNYGYGMLLAMFNREIVCNGYITQLGLFHDNTFNLFNLASDLMEPYRILVDRIVVEMQPEKFEKDERLTLLDVCNYQVYIDGYKRQIDGAIRVYCKSVFDALEQENVDLLKLYSNEL